MKIDLDTVTTVVKGAISDSDLVNELLQALVNAQQEKNAEAEAAKPPKKEVDWEWIVYCKNESYWVLQASNDSFLRLDALIEKARNDFNTTKKGRKYPIGDSIADCFECIPAKIWKKYDIRIKTKEQALPYFSK